jgi:hypothetical protein
VTSLDALYRALPISSEHIRIGTQTNCGGIAAARIDLTAAQAYEFVDATPPPRADLYEDQELADRCVANVRAGIELELTELFGELPSVRVVLHQVLLHLVDSNEWINRRAGQTVVRVALRNAGLDDVPSPESRYRVIPPRPSGSRSGTT